MASVPLRTSIHVSSWSTQRTNSLNGYTDKLDRHPIARSHLSILQGSLVDVPADGFVCYASTSLALHSVVASRLVEIGGASIRTECAKHLPVDIGEAVVISAGKLPARYILVAVTNHIKSAPTIESIRAAVGAVLTHASALGLSSLALPTIRVNKQTSPDDALLAILAPIAEHLSGPTTLNEVVLVVDEMETFPLLSQRLANTLDLLAATGQLRAVARGLAIAEQLLTTNLPLPPYLDIELAQLQRQQVLLYRNALALFHEWQQQGLLRSREAVRVECLSIERELQRLNTLLLAPTRVAPAEEREFGGVAHTQLPPKQLLQAVQELSHNPPSAEA